MVPEVPKDGAEAKVRRRGVSGLIAVAAASGEKLVAVRTGLRSAMSAAVLVSFPPSVLAVAELHSDLPVRQPALRLSKQLFRVNWLR